MNMTENPEFRREVAPKIGANASNASNNSSATATPSPAKSNSHSLEAKERREMLVRGVCEVLSFDEHNVRLVTTAGILNLEGRELRIHTLNTKDGVVAVTGMLDGVLYENDAADTPPAPATSKRRFGRSR